MSEPGISTTTDIDLAAYSMLRGLQLAHVDTSRPGAVFAFENPEGADAVYTAYRNADLTVRLHEFLAHGRVLQPLGHFER